MPKLSEVRLTKRTIEDAGPGSFLWDREVRGFGLRVTNAGSKTFVFRFRSGGRQRCQRIGRYPDLSVSQARLAVERLRSLACGEGGPMRSSEHPTTLIGMLEHYCATGLSQGLRPRTLRDAATVFRLVPDEVREKRLQDITKADVRRLHAVARSDASPAQANRLLAVVSRLFSLAEEEDWWSGHNPCRGVRKFSEDQRSRHLSQAEVSRLLRACSAYAERDSVSRNAANAVRLLLLTGARLQEVLRAEWSEFDLIEGVWEKPSAHTKTKRKHRLLLDGPALALLRDMKMEAGVSAHLFPGRLAPHGVCRPRADLKRPWIWITREAGLDRVRIHDLRRTTASFMLSGGAPLACVGAALGHTQASTTARYAQLFDSVQRDQLRQAGEWMMSLGEARVRQDLGAAEFRSPADGFIRSDKF
jgi:integrase